MKAFLKKLTSRKFLAAVAGIAVGLAVVFGVDESTITSVVGAVTALASVLTYILTEGRIDAAAVGQAITATQSAVEAVKSEATNTTTEG